MNDPLSQLLQPLGLEATLFPPTSRYHGRKVLQHRRADGSSEAYLERRFLPQPERFSDLGVHTVVEGDRLDLLAGRYLGDGEQFWRLADPHRELQPEELTVTIGRRLRITLPEGIPGMAET